MKVFKMIRNNDESGISGTGKVLEGSIFSNGQVVVYWLSTEINSFGIFKNYLEFYQIHVGSHPTNNTEIIFNEFDDAPVKRERRKNCKHCKKSYADHPRDSQRTDEKFVRSCSGSLVELGE